VLGAVAVIETRVSTPMFDLPLVRIRAFTAGNIANLLAARDRCATAPATTTAGDTVLTRFGACAAGAEVDLVVYPGADHNWPAGVTDLMWTFLSGRHFPAPATRSPAAPKPALA